MFHYQVYRYRFKEGDFSQDSYIYGLSNMLFKKDIEVNGVLVQSHFVKRDPQAQQVTVKFPSFPGKVYPAMQGTLFYSGEGRIRKEKLQDKSGAAMRTPMKRASK